MRPPWGAWLPRDRPFPQAAMPHWASSQQSPLHGWPHIVSGPPSTHTRAHHTHCTQIRIHTRTHSQTGTDTHKPYTHRHTYTHRHIDTHTHKDHDSYTRSVCPASVPCTLGKDKRVRSFMGGTILPMTSAAVSLRELTAEQCTRGQKPT